MGRFVDAVFALLFACVLLRVATTDVVVQASDLVALSLVLAAVGFSRFDPAGGDTAASLVVRIALIALVALSLVVPLTDISLLSRAGDLAFLYVAILAFVGYRRGARSSIRPLVPYLCAFGTVVGLFLYHSLDVPPGSGLAAFPIYAALMLGFCLFVVPRYVEAEFLFRFVSRVSGAIVLVGLPSLFVGPYSVLFLDVSPWAGTLSPWFVGEVPVLRSIFPNPNTLGLLVFPGVLAGVVELHRTYVRNESVTPWLLVPGTVLAINSLGLYLSNSRASMLATAIGVSLYAGTALYGRRVVPAVLAAVTVLVPALMLGLYTGALPIDPANRFTLWGASAEAFLAGPTLLGAGVLSTSELIAPFLPEGLSGQSPHNSYLSVLLRIGLVGGVAYCVLVIGPIAHAAMRIERVNAGMLALATGFAVHQLFEGYTLFQYGPGSVLGALAVGYVIAGLVPGSTDG